MEVRIKKMEDLARRAAVQNLRDKENLPRRPISHVFQIRLCPIVLK